MSTEIITKNIKGLTERDCKILHLVARGFSNNEIADELFVSVNTVKSSMTVIFKKLGVKNRYQAVYAAAIYGVYTELCYLPQCLEKEF